MFGPTSRGGSRMTSSRTRCACRPPGGLGKLGEERAVDYLTECLLTPQGTDRFRCAQAICDIHGWPFEWHLSHVESTAERVRSERVRNT